MGGAVFPPCYLKVKVKLLSPVQLFATPWSVAHQALPSMGFSILEWVAISFSRGSSWPRDWTRVSSIVGRRFTVWATREVQRPNYGGGNEDNGDRLKKVPCMPYCTQRTDPATGHRRPTPPLHTPGWASLGQSLVGTLLLFPGSWCTQGFVCALPESVSPVLCKFWLVYSGVNVQADTKWCWYTWFVFPTAQ